MTPSRGGRMLALETVQGSYGGAPPTPVPKLTVKSGNQQGTEAGELYPDDIVITCWDENNLRVPGTVVTLVPQSGGTSAPPTAVADGVGEAYFQATARPTPGPDNYLATATISAVPVEVPVAMTATGAEPEPGLEDLVIIAGDGQSAVEGGNPYSTILQFQAVGSDGLPKENVVVTLEALDGGGVEQETPGFTPLQIITTNLPNAVDGVAYSEVLLSQGWTDEVWTVLSGALPGWATLTDDLDGTARIHGTPSGAPTTHNFTIQLDGTGNDTQAFTLATTADVWFFHDDFSSGDLSHTENGASWHGSNATLVTDRPDAQPGKCLRFRYGADPEGNDSNAEQRFWLAPFGNVRKHIWIQYDIWYPAGGEDPEGLGPGVADAAYYHRHESSGGRNNKFIRVWGSDLSQHSQGYGDGTKQGFSTDTNTNHIPEFMPALGDSFLMSEFHAWPSGAIGNYQSGKAADFVVQSVDPAYNLGEWITIGMEFQHPTGDGSADAFMRMYVNNVKVLDTGNINARWASPYGFDRGYLQGWANSGFLDRTHIWIKDVRFSELDPGWP